MQLNRSIEVRLPVHPTRKEPLTAVQPVVVFAGARGPTCRWCWDRAGVHAKLLTRLASQGVVREGGGIQLLARLARQAWGESEVAGGLHVLQLGDGRQAEGHRSTGSVTRSLVRHVPGRHHGWPSRARSWASRAPKEWAKITSGKKCDLRGLHTAFTPKPLTT